MSNDPTEAQVGRKVEATPHLQNASHVEINDPILVESWSAAKCPLLQRAKSFQTTPTYLLCLLAVAGIDDSVLDKSIPLCDIDIVALVAVVDALRCGGHRRWSGCR